MFEEMSFEPRLELLSADGERWCTYIVYLLGGHLGGSPDPPKVPCLFIWSVCKYCSHLFYYFFQFVKQMTGYVAGCILKSCSKIRAYLLLCLAFAYCKHELPWLESKLTGTFIPRSESSCGRKFPVLLLGAKIPGSEKSVNRKIQHVRLTRTAVNFFYPQGT